MSMILLITRSRGTERIINGPSKYDLFKKHWFCPGENLVESFKLEIFSIVAGVESFRSFANRISVRVCMQK